MDDNEIIKQARREWNKQGFHLFLAPEYQGSSETQRAYLATLDIKQRQAVLDLAKWIEEQARADERAKCLKGSFYRRTGTFYCEGCSFKCQASDCECICHKPLVQIAFNRGIKKGLSSAEESFAKRLKEAEKKAFSEGQADLIEKIKEPLKEHFEVEIGSRGYSPHLREIAEEDANEIIDIIRQTAAQFATEATSSPQAKKPSADDFSVASESLLRKKED